MMTPFLHIVQVPDARSKDTSRLRIAGVLENGRTCVVGSMLAGDRTAVPELTFELGEAAHLVRRCLSGDQRALTTPGLARILSATVEVLFRIAAVAGSIQEIPDGDDGPDIPDDRDAAAGAERDDR